MALCGYVTGDNDRLAIPDASNAPCYPPIEQFFIAFILMAFVLKNNLSFVRLALLSANPEC